MWDVGTKAVCIINGKWRIDTIHREPHFGPKKDEMVTVSAICEMNGGLFLQFEEYGTTGRTVKSWLFGLFKTYRTIDAWYNSKDFRPVDEEYSEEEIENVNINELAEILKEEPEPVDA